MIVGNYICVQILHGSNSMKTYQYVCILYALFAQCHPYRQLSQRSGVASKEPFPAQLLLWCLYRIKYVPSQINHFLIALHFTRINILTNLLLSICLSHHMEVSEITAISCKGPYKSCSGCPRILWFNHNIRGRSMICTESTRKNTFL